MTETVTETTNVIPSTNASNNVAKRRGRPVTTGTGRNIGVRMLSKPLAEVDAWIARQNEPSLSRSEAIRRLVSLGLAVQAGRASENACAVARDKTAVEPRSDWPLSRDAETIL